MVLGVAARCRDRAPAFADADIPHRVAVFADADIPHRVAVFADAYRMTARHRAELAPFAVDMARRYHGDARALAELDRVLRKLSEDGARTSCRALRGVAAQAAPAITAPRPAGLPQARRHPELGRQPATGLDQDPQQEAGQIRIA